MRRQTECFRSRVFDLAIIGGGVYGTAIAREAALRGLSVALVEKDDFGHATSANSLKVIHGGFRSLKTGDIAAVRQGAADRMRFIRLAPHLVRPLPVLLPTYGHGARGRELFACALKIYDFACAGQNDHARLFPKSRMVTREECIRFAPGIHQEGLTGGALFYDAQAGNTERLTLAFLLTAVEAGSCAVNYCEVQSFLMEAGRVHGVRVKDRVAGSVFDIRAKCVVNTGGPWMNRIWGLMNGARPRRRIPLAKAMNVITRPLVRDVALGISAKRDAHSDRSERYWFIAPWRGHSLIGTSQSPCEEGNPDALRVSGGELDAFLDTFHAAYPSSRLRRQDILRVHCGLVPAQETPGTGGEVALAVKSRLVDHSAENGPEGLLSVIGTKYTASVRIAEKVVDRAFRKINRDFVRSTSRESPLCGAETGEITGYAKREMKSHAGRFKPEFIQRLVMTYGTRYTGILDIFEEDAALSERVSQDAFLTRAEVVHAVRREMAVRLSDVVLRRTELGTLGHPGRAPIEGCARTMAEELGWDADETRAQTDEVERFFASAGIQ